MRKVIIPLIFLLPYLALCIELEDRDEYLLFKMPNYHFRLYKTKGTFDFLLKDKEGNLHPIHRSQGESPWFGYNGPNGEMSSSRNQVSKINRGRWREGYVVSIQVPLEQGAYWEGEFYIRDDYLVVRSLIKSETSGGISIVRLAPRFEVDIELFNRYCFSLPEKIIEGRAKELGRPGYAGVLGWGGPKSYASLDPSAPFFALYNPDLGTGFLFLYPFYDKLWKGKHIFLQLWEGGINYFYAGWGDEKDLGKENFFAIIPLNVFSPQEIRRKAEKLNKEIEDKVRNGIFPFKFITSVLLMEEKLNKNLEMTQKLLQEKLGKFDNLSPEGARKLSDLLFNYQVLLLCSEKALGRGDYETALQYSERMLKLLEM